MRTRYRWRVWPGLPAIAFEPGPHVDADNCLSSIPFVSESFHTSRSIEQVVSRQSHKRPHESGQGQTARTECGFCEVFRIWCSLFFCAPGATGDEEDSLRRRKLGTAGPVVSSRSVRLKDTFSRISRYVDPQCRNARPYAECSSHVQHRRL